MSLQVLFKQERVTGTDFALPLGWTVHPDEAARERNPFEVDDEELGQVLAELPEAPAELPERLVSLEQAEVSSLWFL